MATIKRSRSYRRLKLCKSSDLVRTASNSVDNKIEVGGIKDQLEELIGIMKDHKRTQLIIHMSTEKKQKNLIFSNVVACQALQ